MKDGIDANASMQSATLTTRPQWLALRDHVEHVRGRYLREWFAADPDRGERLAAEGAGLYLDYSKQRVGDDTLRLLFELADACGVAARIEAMFTGQRINFTERRPALHVALRMPASESLSVDGVDVVPEVHAVLARMRDFAGRVRDGRWIGASGRRIRHIVNIGIGGSDLGPVMAYEVHRISMYVSSRTSIRPILKKPRVEWTRPKRCSLSAPRPSPRRRR
jgi:glucose-6-phosphate isomerase